MPDFISIDASELEAFGAQIGAAGELINSVSSTLVAKVGQDTREFAQIYPARNTATRTEIYGKPFKTDKQRRFFFSALRRGDIVVPYQRTGHEGRTWLLRLIPGGDTFVAEVYNDNPYRRWVQGARREQARIHAGRWSSQEDIEEAAARVLPARLAEAESELERLFLARLGK